MGYETGVLGLEAVDRPLAQAWDALPAGRGVQADYLDSHAWLTSWCHGMGAAEGAKLRIPIVRDGDLPLAMLPVVARSPSRWESAGSRRGMRLRYRPVLGTEQADEETIGLLAEEVSKARVRELTLSRVPSRDPATRPLVAALRQSGYRVHQHEFSSDNLAVVDHGWQEYRDRFASYERSVRRTLKRMQPWTVRLDEYGPRTTDSAVDGFALYAELMGQSWKGLLRSDLRAHWLELVWRAEQLGWCRIYVLRVDGMPAAAEVWFRLGEVASASSTVYDQRLAVLGPGAVIMWQAQERMLTESPAPRLLDLLPGRNPSKDRLATERPPLLFVEAERRTLVSGASFALRRRGRSIGGSAVGRLVRLRRARVRSRTGAATRVRVRESRPANPTLPVERFNLDAYRRRFLAMAGGHRSPQAMSGTWAAGDTWWCVGKDPAALFRVGVVESKATEAREVVLLQACPERVEALVDALAAGIGSPVRASLPDPDGRPGTPILVHQSVLPWPASWSLATSTG